jgi:trigger factor
VEFDETKGLQLEAQVEVEPEFALGAYRGIPLTSSPVTVTAEDVSQALTRLQESMAQLVPIPRERSGSSARDPEASGRGTGEGQAKEKRVPALDHEFAKDVGFETLDQLKTHLEAKLREQQQTQHQQDLERQLCDALLARHQCDLPQQLVGRQTERLKREFQARLLLGGMSEEQVQQELSTYEVQVQTNAVRHVKLAFILERIAHAEGLSVTQDEVADRLWKLSQRLGKDPAEMRRTLDAKGLWPSILSSILQDKTMKCVMDAAKVTEQVSSVIGH